jgi:hypothetical protein
MPPKAFSNRNCILVNDSGFDTPTSSPRVQNWSPMTSSDFRQAPRPKVTCSALARRPPGTWALPTSVTSVRGL